MKLIVLGADGMLGHKMYQALRAKFPNTLGTLWREPKGMARRFVEQYPGGGFHVGLDVMDAAALRGFLTEQRPAFIVNCIGVIKQRDTAKMAIPSIQVNSLMPHLLAEWASAWGGRVVHFSTDCVFSGRKGNYVETDPSDAEDLYGKSKFLGEVACENALTLRTSIIGRELENFQSLLEWFLAQRGKTIRGFTRVIYSGVTTNFMAELVARVIAARPDLHGLLQVASQALSKHDLLLKLRDVYKLDIDIQSNDNEICDRSMKADAFVARTGWNVPSWDQLIEEMVADPTPYHLWKYDE